MFKLASIRLNPVSGKVVSGQIWLSMQDTVIQTHGMLLDFWKAKKYYHSDSYFLCFPKVLQYPVCLDHSILHGKSFGISLKVINLHQIQYQIHISVSYGHTNIFQTTCKQYSIYVLRPIRYWYESSSKSK